MQIQVVPKYVNPPKKPGGKYGNIKTADNALHWVPVNHLGVFMVGQAANISTEYQQWGDMQASVVTNVNGVDITGQAPNPQGQVPRGDRPSPLPQNVPASDTDESIFVTGIVGRAMGSGQFGVTDIDILAKAAVAAWKNRHGSPQTFGATDPQASLGPPSGQMPDGRDEPPYDSEFPPPGQT